MRNENPDHYDPESTLVMDSKRLFDALDSELPQDDRKSALESSCVERCVDLDGAHTTETLPTARRSSREHIRNHCSICCVLECTK